VASVLVAQAAVDFVAVAGGAAALWGTSRPSVDFFAVSRRVLAVGAPFAAGGALAMLLTDGEKLIIGLAGSLENFTYYSVPFNASYRLTALASALSSVLLPRIAWAVGAGDSAAAAHIARRATRMTVGGMALLLAPLIGIAPDILRLWLGEDFAAHASWPARIILVGLLANTAAFTPHAVVRAVAAPSTLTVLYACELPVYLAAVWILVPVLGPAGAALGWATRVLTDALLLAWIAGRALDRPVIAAREVVLPLSMLAGLALACEVLGDGAPAAARAVISLGIGTSIWIALWTRDDRKLVLRLLRPPEHERG
jgi:O-antigen/teichoic acid export membrane protein